MADDIVAVPLDVVACQDIAARLLRENMETPRDNSYIRASGIGHCQRKIGYQLLGFDEMPLTAHQQATFDIGHAMGDRLTFLLRDMGWLDVTPYINEHGYLDWRGDSEEEIVDHEHRLKGHYDAFSKPLKRVTKTVNGVDYLTYEPTTQDDPEGKRYLIDFKTMSDRVRPSWQKDSDYNNVIEIRKSVSGIPYVPLGKTRLKHDNGYGGNSPEENSVVYPGKFKQLKGIPKDYWLQLHIYARAKKADGIMLIVLGKDVEDKLLYKRQDYLLNCPIKVFTYDGLDPEALREIDEKASYIYSFTDRSELPPRPAGVDPKKFPCAWCSHRHHCLPDLYQKSPGLAEVRPIALEGLTVRNAA